MIRFGTGGWRAVIGDEFTRANIQILANIYNRTVLLSFYSFCDKIFIVIVK